MLAARRADALECLVRGFATGFAGEIAETDDADEPFLGIKHGQAAYLLIAHALRNDFNFFVLARADDAIAHQFADRRVRSAAFGDATHSNVAVGDHADHLVAFAYRDGAGVRPQHE